MHSMLQACAEAFSLPCLANGWVVTAGLGLLALVSLYAYSTWTYDIFKSQGIPGPKPLPFFGNVIDFFRMDPTQWQTEYARKYGMVYGMFIFRRPMLIVSDPELIKDITVKKFRCFTNSSPILSLVEKPLNKFLTTLVDDHWKHVRAAISPVFTSGKLKEMAPTINDCADRLATYVSQHDGEDVDVKDITSAFTLDTIAGTAFGLDVRSCEDPENPFLKHARTFFALASDRSLKRTFVIAMSMMSTTVSKALAKIGLRLTDSEAMAYFDGVVQSLFDGNNVKEARRNFVQLCSDQLVDIDRVNKDSLRTTAGVTWTTAGLLADEVTANAIVFILAGYETTSSLLTTFFYAMAENPRVQEKLYEELRSSMGETALPTYDNVKNNEYLDWCIDETLRMYPPASRFDRVCGTATQVGDINVTPGTRVIFPTYAIHHNPTYWPEPEVFRPERFSSEECRDRPASVHVPFGFGPRSCIGMRLAQLEAKVVIAKIISTYTVAHGRNFQNAPLKWKKQFFLLTPQDRIKLRFTKRLP